MVLETGTILERIRVTAPPRVVALFFVRRTLRCTLRDLRRRNRPLRLERFNFIVFTPRGYPRRSIVVYHPRVRRGSLT